MPLLANLKKTVNYLKKNGLEETSYVVLERLCTRKQMRYQYEPPEEEELKRQRDTKWEYYPKLSLIVPAYETKPIYMQDLILSVTEQSYQNYELVIADASESDAVSKVVKDFQTQYDGIVYLRLESNEGISGNTNAALTQATGEYIGLLDHDDLLTPDALYYVAKEIEKCRKKKIEPELIYTDEDKTNTYLEKYYEPHYKTSFNYDLLLTNNYVCHLSFYRKDVICKLGLRKEYDGAQDYDLVLRTAALIEKEYEGTFSGAAVPWEKHIRHIPHILYHWRCHEESTAQNPESKLYAYEAGRRAIEAYLADKDWNVEVRHLKHLGFYWLDYSVEEYETIFQRRKDIGVIGGPIYVNHKITGGAMGQNGNVMYRGLHRRFSGYMHRGVLQQDACAVDLRNMIVRKDLIKLFEKTTGYTYPVPGEIRKKQLSDEEEEKIRKKSIDFCNKVRGKSISILYNPDLL